MSLPQRPRHPRARPILRPLSSSIRSAGVSARAVVATIVTMLLALGVVTVGVAAPASAHHNTISVTVACTPDFRWLVTWSVSNSESDKTETITASTDVSLVPVGTTFAAGETKTFTEFAATPAKKVLTLDATWSNGVKNHNSATLPKAQFTPVCSAPVVKSTGLYLYKKLDPTKDAAWNNSGLQTKIATWDGWSFTHHYPVTLPSDVCGPWWGVQQDEIYGAQSLFPTNIEYPDNPGFSSGVYYAGRHDNLSALVTVPDCAPVPHVSVTAGACLPGDGGSSKTVSVELSNTGNAPVTFTSTNGVNATLQAGETKTVAANPVSPAGASFDIVATGTGFTQTFPITVAAFPDCTIVVVPPTPSTSIVATCTQDGASTDVLVGNDFAPAEYAVGADFEAQIFVNGTLRDTFTVASGASVARHFDFPSDTGSYTVQVKVDGRIVGEKSVDSNCAIVTGADPTAQTCVDGVLVDGRIHVLLDSHVVYAIDGTVVTNEYTTVAPGEHTVTAALADAAAIYVLEGPTSWKFTSEAFVGDCSSLLTHPLVTPTATSSNIACDVSGSFTLSDTEGVVWTVDGTVKPAGTYRVAAASTVHVVASTVSSDYGFELGAQTDWRLVFTTPTDCGQLVTHPLVTPVVTSVDRTCSVNGSYTLAPVDGVVYTVNGNVQAPGTYPVSTAKTVTVVAGTSSSDFGFEEGAQTIWNLVFTDPSNCGGLTTLAFTGSDGALAGGLLIGLIFVMIGAGVITASRLNKRTN